MSAISLISYICAVSDINECDLNTHNCSINAECFNTNGSFVCNCSDGFSGNGVICKGMQTTFPLGLIQIKTRNVIHFHKQRQKGCYGSPVDTNMN